MRICSSFCKLDRSPMTIRKSPAEISTSSGGLKIVSPLCVRIASTITPVFRNRGQSSNQSTRSEDTGLAKAVVLCGIGDDGKHSCGRRLCNTLLVAVNHEEGSVCPLKFITSVPAHAAKTADDEMVL